MEEKYELVDINGQNTGRVLNGFEAYDIKNIPEGFYIAVVGVVIINTKNEVLLQKRSRFKKSNPGKWGICGGKVNLGETPIIAGIRETFEEIGINLNDKDFNFLSHTILNKTYFSIFYIKQDVNIIECKLQKEEVEEIKYFKIEELESLDSEGFEWLESLKRLIK